MQLVEPVEYLIESQSGKAKLSARFDLVVFQKDPLEVPTKLVAVTKIEMNIPYEGVDEIYHSDCQWSGCICNDVAAMEISMEESVDRFRSTTAGHCHGSSCVWARNHVPSAPRRAASRGMHPAGLPSSPFEPWVEQQWPPC